MLAVLIFTISSRWSVKCSEIAIKLAHPEITPLLVGSGCPAFFHATVARSDRMMATPSLVCPLFLLSAAASPVLESDTSCVPWWNT
jgi:hypothetical protein